MVFRDPPPKDGSFPDTVRQALALLRSLDNIPGPENGASQPGTSAPVSAPFQDEAENGSRWIEAFDRILKAPLSSIHLPAQPAANEKEVMEVLLEDLLEEEKNREVELPEFPDLEQLEAPDFPEFDLDESAELSEEPEFAKPETLPDLECFGDLTMPIKGSLVEAPPVKSWAEKPLQEPELAPALPLEEPCFAPETSDFLGDLLGLASASEPWIDDTLDLPNSRGSFSAATTIDSELLSDFAHEAEDHLRTLNQRLPILLEMPGDWTVLQDIRRAVHTIKGCAAMAGFREMTRLAHRMEDLLDQLYEGQRPVPPEATALLIAATDALEELAAGGSESDTLAGLYTHIDLLISGAEGETPGQLTPLVNIVALPAAPPTVNAVHPPRVDHFVRVPVERLDELARLVRELGISCKTLEQLRLRNGRQMEELQVSAALGQQAQLLGILQEELIGLRQAPLHHLKGRLQLTVNGLAQALKKKVQLVLEGENTEVDKVMLEEMAEPLLHLLRNAVDHGIELPERRRKQGKSETGVIRVRARRESNQVVLEISDDGVGIDPALVRQMVLARGSVAPAELAVMSAEELIALVFRPGVSTARRVTEVSGRGVGLDIVKMRVQQVQGTVTVCSRPGAGTTFTIRLPQLISPC